MKSWQHIYYSASRAAEALLYLIFTLVWLLITYQNCVRMARPNKSTHFPAHKKLYCAEWWSQRNTSLCCPQTPTVIFECFRRADLYGAASHCDNYQDKNPSVKTGNKIASSVYFICFRKKLTGWKMEHNILSTFWKSSIWESSTIKFKYTV